MILRRAWLSAILAAAVATIAEGAARADDKQACGAAYEQTQLQRKAGKLVAARQQAALCTRDVCAEFIRADCARWLGEMEASQPTVVFDVRDAAGKETGAVRVDLDGELWITALDGQARPIDPGSHALHYMLASGESADDVVQIREGEKNRKLTATFQKGGVAPAPAQPAGSGERSRMVGLIVGAGGVVVGGIGAVVGVMGTIDFQHPGAGPNGCDPTCQGNQTSAHHRVDIGLALVGIGSAALVTGGVLWLTARPRGARATTPQVGVTPGGVIVTGRF